MQKKPWYLNDQLSDMAINRRHFLMGATAMGLAVPVAMSLTRRAVAAAAKEGRPASPGLHRRRYQ
jgi:hypothetical protein